MSDHEEANAAPQLSELQRRAARLTSVSPAKSSYYVVQPDPADHLYLLVVLHDDETLSVPQFERPLVSAFSMKIRLEALEYSINTEI